MGEKSGIFRTFLTEVTVPNLKAFDPTMHVKVLDVKHNIEERNGIKSTVISLPYTKVAREKGEDIFWARQEGITDPKDALDNHLHLNNPPPDSHLFTYKFNNSLCPMTRKNFLDRIGEIVRDNGLEKIPGHGIRVGSTVEYLLRGVPFPVVKAKGRWKSDAFRGYLRSHAQIMAPYVQSDPKAYDALITYSMPINH